MQKHLFCILIFFLLSFSGKAQLSVYHPIQKDINGNLVHWYNPNHGTSYDHCLELVWNFWKNVDTCCGGHKFYMMDHSHNATISGNKLGGDQLAMALSSWSLYYAYTGDTDLIKNMVYIADHFITHSLSNSFDAWPNFPYPCNYTYTTLPLYDGDFLLGAGWTQPDKAGSFANELVTLYKITGKNNYLQLAVGIANTLADKVQPGNVATSPYPFKVNAGDGSLPPSVPATWHYTASLVPILRLFENLKKLNQGNIVQYDTATAKIIRWVKTYPLQTNEWGSFFENIAVPSNTEINSVSMAWYILEHNSSWGNTWQQDSRSILDWTLSALGSHAYDTLGVTAIFEQSVDLKEAGSHTSRLAATELLYSKLTGDTSRRVQALRQLDWSNYLCDFDGKVRFTPPSGTVWYTDGYGDYVKHFLRAMAAYPIVAPDSSNHLLESSSVITYMQYLPYEIHYNSYDDSSTETLRLASKPLEVKAGGVSLNELGSLISEGWTWTPYPLGGVLKVRHDNAAGIDILWAGTGIRANDDGKLIELFPNPATEQVGIHFTSKPIDDVKIEIINATGEKVKELTANVSSFSNRVQLNVSDLQSGIYFLHISSVNFSASKKLVVTK